MDLIKPPGIPMVRYPGGNFGSGFRWEDNVGPVSQRSHRLERAWRTLESNKVGLHKFSTWCNEIGASVMMTLNLGTRGIDAACNFFEYCNHPGGTYYSDLRKAHGAICDYIYINNLGMPYQPNFVTQHFRLLLHKNGLRHTCASLLLKNRVGMKDIQEWLGHSDYATTANIYAHLDVSSKDYSAKK